MQNPIYMGCSDYSDYNRSTDFKVSVAQMDIQVHKWSYLKQQYIDFSVRLDFRYFWNPKYNFTAITFKQDAASSYLTSWSYKPHTEVNQIQIQNITYQEFYILNMYNRHVLILRL